MAKKHWGKSLLETVYGHHRVLTLNITLQSSLTGELRDFLWYVHSGELYAPYQGSLDAVPAEVVDHGGLHQVGEVIKRRLHAFLITGGIARAPELWLRVNNPFTMPSMWGD